MGIAVLHDTIYALKSDKNEEQFRNFLGTLEKHQKIIEVKRNLNGEAKTLEDSYCSINTSKQGQS